ncbi:unnamed protein product [Pieris macdunnoughi]|uniref:FLYWCH-type domain-containing protein n=1 Tax=Pieris macdunnoughi TaxID=345717 RepID=A0A821Q5N1_9NEOP|nr:unnamed protein product [Pieris macdunnoughi]
MLVKNRQGKDLAIVDGFTFYPNKRNISIQWRCTRGLPCKAHFTTDYSLNVKKVVVCLSENGNEIALYRGYTYRRNRKYPNKWRCRTNAYCRGRLTTDEHDRLKRVTAVHKHPRGTYVLLSYFVILVVEWLAYAMVIRTAKKDPTFGDVQQVPTAKVELQLMKKIWLLKMTSIMFMPGLTILILGSKGKEQLFIGGYKFYKRVESKNKVRWCCTRRSCRAAVYSVEGQIVKVSNAHSHKPTYN